MRIRLTLHSIFRQRLPAEAQGKAQVELPEASTLGDVVAQFGLQDAVLALNGCLVHDASRALHEGDTVEAFLRVGGG